jgi:hypothetical protein
MKREVLKIRSLEMSSIILIHPEEKCEVVGLHVINKCNLFRNNLILTTVPYKIRSSVPLSIFLQFVLALNGNTLTITDSNLVGLSLLCEEFGFETLGAQLLEFKQSRKQNGIEDTEVRTRITTIEEQLRQCTHDIEMLQRAFARITANHRFNSFDSQIISGFPDIFAEFQGKHFEILWRGSRDGFKAQEFHLRCDGHANTLIVILDTNGNIFGGFTPVERESRVWNGMDDLWNNCFKADDSQKSFLFTLKNPHNIPARRFALKTEEKQQAIYCDSIWSPCFGSFPSDIYVCDGCNTSTGSATSLGLTYTNNTGLGGEIVLTGSRNFQVKEIEVFEITA